MFFINFKKVMSSYELYIFFWNSAKNMLFLDPFESFIESRRNHFESG